MAPEPRFLTVGDLEIVSLPDAHDDVDIVFSTHHHSDHIGWNVKEGRPLFRQARYVNGAAAWDWTLSNRTENWIRGQLTPLLEADVDLVEDGAENHRYRHPRPLSGPHERADRLG